MSKKQKWKPPRPREEGLKECLARAADQFGVGAGAIMDMPEVQCTPRGALLEGCHGVLEYTEQRIRAAGKDVTVQVCGMDLELESMSDGEMNIRGKIASVEFIRS